MDNILVTERCLYLLSYVKVSHVVWIDQDKVNFSSYGLSGSRVVQNRRMPLNLNNIQIDDAKKLLVPRDIFASLPDNRGPGFVWNRVKFSNSGLTAGPNVTS